MVTNLDGESKLNTKLAWEEARIYNGIDNPIYKIL